ncbi:MAG: hypothetical protein AAGJ87_06895, partial [Pseudomonadota bacterium]
PDTAPIATKGLITARFVPGTRIPTYIACGFFESPYIRFVVLVASTALMYVTIMFGLFHGAGEVVGERATVIMPFVAIGAVSGYILIRWLRHRNRKLGPMTPLSDDFDAPLPPSDDAHFDGASQSAKQASATEQTSNPATKDSATNDKED